MICKIVGVLCKVIYFGVFGFVWVMLGLELLVGIILLLLSIVIGFGLNLWLIFFIGLKFLDWSICLVEVLFLYVKFFIFAKFSLF